MASASPARSVALALDVIGWSLRFYGRHLGLVVGISLIPSAQRAVSQLWGEQMPSWVGMAGEVVTTVVRVMLFVVILRIAILDDDRLREVPGAAAWQRVVRFARREWRSLVVQVLAFAALFAFADLVPDRVIAPRIPAGAHDTYWATLLAIKNPTVIAFSMIWQIGAVRQALLLGAPCVMPAPGSGHDRRRDTVDDD